MKKLILLLGLITTACSSGLLVDNVDPRDPNQPELVLIQGEQLYSTHCEACHGEQGKGTPIAFQLQRPDVDYFSFWVREGRDEGTFDVLMPDYSNKDLSDDEMNSIIFFLRNTEKPTDGAGLYAVYCANCHGIDGSGGPVSEKITDEAQDPTELDDFFDTVRDGEGKNPGKRKGFMPEYPPSEISDEEINLIISFLQTQ